MMTPQGLQIAPPEDPLTRLGIVANGVVIVDIMFRVCVAGGRRLPVAFRASRICFSSMDCSTAWISKIGCPEPQGWVPIP
jgi:hypothetical protein